MLWDILSCGGMSRQIFSASRDGTGAHPRNKGHEDRRNAVGQTLERTDMKRTTLIALTAATLALGTAATFARDGGHRGDRTERIDAMFERFDTDGNGEITRDEFDAARSDRFEGADTNGDGLLSTEELVQAALARHSEEAITERVERMIERLDKDGDQALSAEELPGDRSNAMFDRADADGDGIVTRAEVEDMRGFRHGQGRRHRNDG